MKRTNQAKARISLNSRKQISLFVGKSTPVNLNPYLELSNYNIEHFKLFQFSANSDVSGHLFFTPTNGKERKRYAMYDEALRSFVAECIEALKENTPTTAKELFNLTSYGEHKETVSITFGEWLQRVIDLYHYNNPHGNMAAQTYVLYEQVQKKCQCWNGGEILTRKVCDVVNADFEAFGEWIEQELNGKNYKNLMKNFAAVMHRAIDSGNETGCTKEKNSLNYKLVNKRINKIPDGSITKSKGYYCFTIEQIKQIISLNIEDVQVQSRGKCKMNSKQKSMYFDIIKFAFYSGMRPIDLLRLRKDSIIDYNGEQRIKYFPRKKFNLLQDSSDEQVNKQIAEMPLNESMRNIIEKYSAMSDESCQFVFPISPNIKHNGKYNMHNDYSHYNHIEGEINLLLKALAKLIGIVTNDKISLYSCRHSAITAAASKRELSVYDIAKAFGTSTREIYNVYVHPGTEAMANIFHSIWL